jgi:hypothetical protein
VSAGGEALLQLPPPWAWLLGSPTQRQLRWLVRRAAAAVMFAAMLLAAARHESPVRVAPKLARQLQALERQQAAGRAALEAAVREMLRDAVATLGQRITSVGGKGGAREAQRDAGGVAQLQWQVGTPDERARGSGAGARGRRPRRAQKRQARDQLDIASDPDAGSESGGEHTPPALPPPERPQTRSMSQQDAAPQPAGRQRDRVTGNRGNRAGHRA